MFKIINWIDTRLPIFSFIKKELGNYQEPKNLSLWWNFGSLLGLALLIQLITGVFLAMHYDPNVDRAFNSVEAIMRDVNYGWLMRYAHANGASMFFICVYLHIFRGLYFGSYKSPRELLWIIGVLLYLAMMATAFLGYTLPWGQMSFWGATVITSIFSAIPFFGQSIVEWLWGGFSVGNATLNRFFALHYLIPFIITALAMVHVVALRQSGSNNPTGIEPTSSRDTIPFHPYYTVKDFVGVLIFFMVFALLIFFTPNYLGHEDNYISADPLITPAHIVPEWYFLPFYAILRSIPSKLGGVISMFGAVVILFFLPWLDTSNVRSGKYRPLFKVFCLLFASNFLFLMWLGAQEVHEPYITLARLSTIYYFAYFLIILPLLGKFEKPKGLPISISATVPDMK